MTRPPAMPDEVVDVELGDEGTMVVVVADGTRRAPWPIEKAAFASALMGGSEPSDLWPVMSSTTDIDSAPGNDQKPLRDKENGDGDGR